MFNAEKPSLEELPSSAQLLRSTIIAAVAAVAADASPRSRVTRLRARNRNPATRTAGNRPATRTSPASDPQISAAVTSPVVAVAASGRKKLQPKAKKQKRNRDLFGDHQRRPAGAVFV